MALTDYNIDTSGSPQDVQRRQALADALMKQGMDSSPAAGGPGGGWITALSRGLSGALGGYQRGAAASEEQQGKSAWQQKMAQVLQGGKIDPTAMVGLAADPWANPTALSAANNAYTAQHQIGREAIADKHQALMERLALNSDKRSQYEFDHTPDQYVPNPRANEPGQPAYIDQLGQAKVASDPTATPEGRAALAPRYGIDPNSPAGRAWVVNGKLPEPSMFDPASPAPASAMPSGANAPSAGTNPDSPTSPVPNAVVPPAAGAPPVAAHSDVNAIDPKTGRREGYLASLNPQVREYIKKIADYELDPRTTSVRGGEREKLMSAVAKYDPSYNQNTFGERAKAFKDFGTGAQGNTIKSFDVAIDHLDLLSRAASAMQNGDVRVLNELRNKWREQTGNELPSNFNALKPLVSGEIAKAAIGSNNALADRQELREPLNAASSAEQFNGVIKGYKGLMAGQLHGLRRQYEYTTGKKDFDQRLSDSTKRELEGAGAAGSASMLDQAKAAIAAGAPRDKVIERLKGAGVDPGDL